MFLPALLDPANWSLVALPVYLLLRSRARSVDRWRDRSAPRLEPQSDPHRDESLARARRPLIVELERSAVNHEAGRIDALGETLFEVEDLLRNVTPRRVREESLESRAYRLWDSWSDASNHGWLHYEPVERSDWPNPGRRMREVLEGRRTFRGEEYRGVLD